jgi:hypothetical protein
MTSGFERLYTETEAAELIGIKARSLRSERLAGRITYKRVAGKIMYRHDTDLLQWMRKGEEPCPDETEDRTLSGSRPAAPGTSPGPRAAEASGEARAKATASALKRRSANSCAASPDRPGRVVPLNS